MTSEFRGSMTALITPFTDNGEALDERAFQDFVEWQIAEGTDGLVPVGTTGESPTLTHDEHKRVVELCVEAAAGRVPVIAGAGSNSTHEALDFARHAEEAGANALLVVTPYYNKPTQEGLYLHFAAVARATDLPLFIYNIPGRSVVDMSVDTMARLARDFDTVVGVKDATNDLARPLATRLAVGEDFIQLSGEDATVAAFLAQGGHGCISVTSNVAPGLCAALHDAWHQGAMDRVAQLRDRLMPLHRAMFCESSPAPAKYGASLLGRSRAAARLPIAPLSETGRETVRAAMDGAGLLAA